MEEINIQRLAVLRKCHKQARDLRDYILKSKHPNQNVIDSANSLITIIEIQAKMINREIEEDL